MADEREDPESKGPKEGGGFDLSEELMRRYSPEKLSKIIAKRAGKGEKLDLLTRQKYEGRFGVDLGNVRVLTGPMAEEFTQKQGAHAVTIGKSQTIMMRGSSEFTGGAAGASLLAHELTHVAQASHGFHKKASDGELGSSESEEEAEETEADVRNEESGGGGGAAQAADREDSSSGEKAATRREMLVNLVLDLVAEDMRIQSQREGIG